ncbi:hypothetical protein E2P81_ATG07624 [Venturia nashicola]|uniref:Uncharacterized protein n=1 Tax=Venturia nashicola TaxID=86259 RepID=A0A4Z1NZQ0_9PEZI|nr:hypothetical protein E6O75_ATG07782 [Venturia nashicola]TLD32134.1 hypothetical protein E2P81_ATG07624 [Venturia nashicola]
MGKSAQEPENMKHRGGTVQRKEDLVPKGPQGEEDEAKIAATTLVNLSRGEKAAAHSNPDDATHLVASPRKMDPTLARQTRNTPKERDYAAFMKFMKVDNPEEDELRAKKQREKNAAMRERHHACVKFKEEIKARTE